jgi:hypothetical protein
MLPFGTDTSGPSDYDIEISDPEIAQALADLIEMGLVVDSGQRRFKNGKWRGGMGRRPARSERKNSPSCLKLRT